MQIWGYKDQDWQTEFLYLSKQSSLVSMGFLTKNNAETMHNYQNGLEQCSTNGKKKTS